jgi:hypothetical protein
MFISNAPYGCKMSGYVLKTVKIYIIIKNNYPSTPLEITAWHNI